MPVELRVAAGQEGDLVVEVQDSGSGMEPSVQRSFSASRGSNGIPIGAPVWDCSSWHRHRARRRIGHEQGGEGTTFRVIFPGRPPLNEHGELIPLVKAARIFHSYLLRRSIRPNLRAISSSADSLYVSYACATARKSRASSAVSTARDEVLEICG